MVSAMGKFFFYSTIKFGFVDGNEVINVSSCQTEGFRDGTCTSPGEKDHRCVLS